MLDQCFSTYVYSDVVKLEERNVIQEELTKTFNVLKETSSFKKRWTVDTHSLSDTTFSKNIIDDYELTHFKKELDFHINAYLGALSFPHDRTYRIDSAWITLNQHKEHSRLHNHGSSDLSGVYYIQTNGEDGDLYFHTPADMWAVSYLTAHLHCDLYAKPEVGKIFLFPAGLMHGVTGNDTKDDRVSIAFNISFTR